MSGTPAPSLRPFLLPALVAMLGGFLFGYDTAVISGAIGALKSHFALDATGEGLAGASAILGCIPGALMAGFLGDKFGRKKSLLAAGLLYVLSAVWSAFPGNFAGFLVARFLNGLGVGAASMICPTYIGEIAPARHRGRLGALFQLGIVLGIGIVFFVNLKIRGIGDDIWQREAGWRWMLGSEGLPAVPFLALLAFVPESPRWLLQVGRIGEGMAVLKRFMGDDEARVEVAAVTAEGARGEAPFSHLFSQSLRRPLIIACGLAVFCQFSGINAIMYYAPKVFAAGKAASEADFMQAVWVGVMNLVFTLVAIAFVDRAGRRPLLLAGSFLQTVFLALAGWMFMSGKSGGAMLWPILGFVGAFAMAMGPIPWILISEIFPGNIRGRATSVGVFMVWVSCYVVAQTFPMLESGIGMGPTFLVYAGCSLASFIFVLRMIPETKGRSLEEISASWAK